MALKKVVLGTGRCGGPLPSAAGSAWTRKRAGFWPPCPPTAICCSDAAATRRRLPRTGPHPAAGQGQRGARQRHAITPAPGPP